MKISTTSTGLLADEYAFLMAQQSELAKKIKAHKAKMLATGRKEFDGLTARVTISHQTGRMAFDGKQAQDMLEAAGWPLPFKPLADATRFNVNAKVSDTSVAA